MNLGVVNENEIEKNKEIAKENRKNGRSDYNTKVKDILDFYYVQLKNIDLFKSVSFDDRKQYNRDIRSFLKNNKTRSEPLTIEDTKRAILIAFQNPWYKKNNKESMLLKLYHIFRSSSYLTDAIDRRKENMNTKTSEIIKKYYVLNNSKGIVDNIRWGYFKKDVNGKTIHVSGIMTKKVIEEEKKRMKGETGNPLKNEYFTTQGNIKGEYGWMVGLKGGNGEPFVGQVIK